MKITKRQLRRIIREEKSKLQESKLVGGVGFGFSSTYPRESHLAEQPISGRHANQMQAQQDYSRTVKDLISILGSMEVTERNGEIYMLIDELEELASRG